MKTLKPYLIALVTILLSHVLNIVRAEYVYLLSSFTSKVGAGNFTYYKLTREGNILLKLHTIEGDADLYVSDKTLQPDWMNYELQCTTCGEDVIEITADLKRPVGIGVYGHPFHDESHFQLSVFMETAGHSTSQGHSHSSSNFGHSRSNGDEEGEESVLWSVFVGILKIIIDILV